MGTENDIKQINSFMYYYKANTLETTTYVKKLNFVL